MPVAQSTYYYLPASPSLPCRAHTTAARRSPSMFALMGALWSKRPSKGKAAGTQATGGSSAAKAEESLVGELAMTSAQSEELQISAGAPRSI